MDGKRKATELESDQQAKTAKTHETATPGTSGVSMEIVKADPKLARQHAESEAADKRLMPLTTHRISLEGNPAYLRTLKERHEIGYRRSAEQKRLEVKSFEIDLDYFRKAIAHVLTHVLTVRYCADASMRASVIDAEIKDIVPLTVDMCMSALYAKLRNINKSFGKHGTRFSTAASYTKEIELPLPLALAIQEFGVVQTHSLPKNFMLIPTIPEGTTHEGREKAPYPAVEYMSYIPTLKRLGILMKSIDPRIKMGSPWWTYKVRNEQNVTDLLCTLPFSHYSDLSAITRSLFCYPESENKCKDIVKFEADCDIYRSFLHNINPGFPARSFLALIHGDPEEWSFGTS